MRLVVDNSLSPKLARRLSSNEHDAIHVRDRNLSTATDAAIFELAVTESRWIVAQDTDFGPLLYSSQAPIGVFLIRLRDGSVDAQFERMNSLSASLLGQLPPRSIVVIEEARLRIRTFS